MLTVMGTICEWCDRENTVSGRSAIFCSFPVSPKELVNFSVVELYSEDGTGFRSQQGIFQLKSWDSTIFKGATRDLAIA